MKITLSPSQLRCFEEIDRLAKPGTIMILGGAGGSGRSTVLRALAQHREGELLTMRQFMEWQRDTHPLRLEETLEWLLTHHLSQSETVLFDDLDRLLEVMRSANYPRQEYVDAALAEVPTQIADEKRTFICVCSIQPPTPLLIAHKSNIRSFTVEDYEFFFKTFLGDCVSSLNSSEIYSAADHLNARQIKSLSSLMKAEQVFSTEAVIRMLSDPRLFIEAG